MACVGGQVVHPAELAHIGLHEQHSVQRLQHHFDHRVGRQRAVQLVELLAAGGGDGDGDAQVFAALAFAQLDGGGVKRGSN